MIAAPVASEIPIRIAFWRIDLGGRGPGEALQEILSRAERPKAKARLISHVAPEILVLSGLDHDHGLMALGAFRDLISDHGHDFPYVLALPSNAGVPNAATLTDPSRPDNTDLAQGYGRFRGERALALLSRFEIATEDVRDFSTFLWRDLPDAQLPDMPPERRASQRLSSTGHWDVLVRIGDNQSLHLLIYQAGPPVFGPDDTWNRARNHDETAFWLAYLDNRLPYPAPSAPLVVIGGSNLDPFDGDGQHIAMQNLLSHPRLQDPMPASAGAVHAASTDRDFTHSGPHALDTVHWPQATGPGNLRVSYILPSAGLRVRASGVFWPAPDSPDATLLGDPDRPPTRHRLVWVDLDPASLN
ncbi:MAG: endonuclease/exonuclease/phosphatase family protein [Roseinatronobacter sp.]